jgi:hypothetical protein
MMYLLVIRPNMLSKGFGDEGYLETLRELWGLKYHGDEKYQCTLRELLHLNIMVLMMRNIPYENCGV